MDRTGKVFLVLCAALFVLGVLFQLNGSSVFIWKQVLHDKSDSGGLLLSTPQAVRSDEWMVWTPAAMWQYEHGFPSENPSLGAGKAPFLYSLPVKHYTTLLRPQLYGFFLFSFERGYAWYWNAKVFGLLSSSFLLFWTLTRKSLLSLFGSLWLFFSNYIQWWFSCPPMLPEMLSSWAIALVAAIALLRSSRWSSRVALSAVLAIAAVNFILCLYPPFQIPLLYLWLGIVAAVLWRHDESLTFDWRATACLFAALALILTALLPFWFECRSTFQMLAATSYPGHRRAHGGEVDWLQLFSGLINFFNSDASSPLKDKSANDAANFFPLWLTALPWVGAA